MERIILRGKTNDRDTAKQYCYLSENKSKGYAKSVIIRKLILTEQKELYILARYILLRKYKGKYLFENSFSIKLSTLNKIVDWANKL